MKKAPETLTLTESSTLVTSCDHSGPSASSKRKAIRDKVLILLMLDAGLRIGEVARLFWRDLFDGEKPYTQIDVPAGIAKMKRPRSIPVSIRLLTALKYYYEVRPSSDVDYMFTISVRQIQRMICNRAVKHIGRKIHPHVLRHTFATHLMRKTSLRIVQELLGHSSLQSTQVYTHPNSDDLRSAIDSLGP